MKKEILEYLVTNQELVARDKKRIFFGLFTYFSPDLPLSEYMNESSMDDLEKNIFATNKALWDEFQKYLESDRENRLKDFSGQIFSDLWQAKIEEYITVRPEVSVPEPYIKPGERGPTRAVVPVKPTGGSNPDKTRRKRSSWK